MSSPGGGGAEKMRIIQTILSAKSHYEVLGVAKDADEALLKSAYKKMVIKVHPDKIASLLDESDKPKAEQAFRAVQNAYECLTVPRQRQIYDMQMESGGSGSSFVPGDTSSSEDDAAPSGGAFLLALLQICIALVLHVFVTLFNDGKAFFTAQALPLHIAIISIFTGWLGLGWGFFRVLFSCMGCYGLYRLVPQEQAWDLLKKGIAWQRRNCYAPEGQTRDCSQSPTLSNPQSLLTCPDGVAYGSRKIERGFLFCLVCNAAHSFIRTTSFQPPLHYKSQTPQFHMTSKSS